jgi:flavin reductase (DIM6/NTAB) family NADH-FMN oxidoreductase RutF
MFYNYSTGSQPKGLFKSCVIPRPIAWISTISKSSVTNLAPFSYFQAVCDTPPMIMFVASPKNEENAVKDTITNIEDTKEFVVNLVTENAKDIMMLSSQILPHNESEIDRFKIPTKKSHIVTPPSIKISPINMECEYVKTINIENNKMIIGKILGISVDESVMENEKIDIKKLGLFCRLGYNEYAVIDRVVHMSKT